MKNTGFDMLISNSHDLTRIIVDKIANTHQDVAVVCNHDLMLSLINDISMYEDFVICENNIYEGDYNKEYILEITPYYEVFVQPLYIQGRYVEFDDSFLYIESSCNSKILSKNMDKNFIYYAFDFENENEEDCCVTYDEVMHELNPEVVDSYIIKSQDDKVIGVEQVLSDSDDDNCWSANISISCKNKDVLAYLANMIGITI